MYNDYYLSEIADNTEETNQKLQYIQNTNAVISGDIGTLINQNNTIIEQQGYIYNALAAILVAIILIMIYRFIERMLK